MHQQPTGRPPLPSVRLLGIRIDAIRLQDLLRVVERAASERSPLRIFYVNAHGMNVAARDSELRANLDAADIVYCDGTGMRLAARLLGKVIPERMTGADWIHDLARQSAERGHSLYLLGGAPGTARDAADKLRRSHPDLRVVGVHAGYGPDDGVIQTIQSAHPDILLVGMGTPRQEKWIAEHYSELEVPVAWAVGALFDFVSGRLPRGPRWMTEHGFEWLCRLAIEPRKLWRRYLIGNPRFLWRVLRARLRRE